MKKKIMIIAGETSGDQHAAEVVKALKATSNDLSFYGMAGPKMREAGVDAIVRAEEMAVMGFVEVLGNFKVIYKAYQTVKKNFQENKPDLLILVDYPGFNLRVAALAKEFGIKVLYYISPQVWAWKKRRIEKIKKYVDMMAVIFPFEERFYQKAGVSVKYVGSPIAEAVHCDLSQLQAREALDLAPEKKTIVLLPGSRKIEINRMLPLMLSVADELSRGEANLQFVLPLANMLSKESVQSHINKYSLPIHLIEEQTYAAIRASDAAICTSGTVTLETALLNVPMVVIYRMNELTFQIAKHLVKVDKIALCNIVAEKTVVKELIQHQASVKNISDEINRILTDTNYADEIKQNFSGLRESLGEQKAAENVAALVLEML